MLGKRPRFIAVAVAATALTVVSGCSSSGSGSKTTSGSTGGSTGSAASGSKLSGTVKLGIIADVGTPVDFADDVAAARAAVLGVNSRGGINGHKVVLDFCNGGLDPNKDAACVRKVIADKPMAMVGTEEVSYEENGDKQFAAAGIANVSPVAYSYDLQDKNSYLTSAGQAFLNAAQDVLGTKYDGKRQVLLRVDIPTTVPYAAAHKKLIPMLGGVYAGVATVPEVAGDLSPQAASLLAAKPDWLNTDATEGADVGILKSMTQLGYSGKMVVAQDALALSTIKSLGSSLANRVQFASGFPPVTAASTIPGVKQFIADMKAEAATGDKAAANYATYNRDVALEGYLGVIAVAKIANAAKSTDAKSFKKAIDAASNVDLGGIIPAWSPNTSVSKAIPRASNDSMYLSEWDNGSQKLLSTTPVKVAAYVDASN